MIAVILSIWCLSVTVVALVLYMTLKVQQSHIELLESELRYAERQLEAADKKQKFVPQNRVFGGKPR